MSNGADIRMFESGWFGQGDAFWQWVKTPDAAPYVEAFTRMYQPPRDDEPFDLLGDDADGVDLLDPAHLERLAADIEARFGKAG